MGHAWRDRGESGGNTPRRVAVCPWCWYARTKADICGVYCTGGFQNKDGSCERFLDYYEEKKRRRKMAFKTNVVKAQWEVVTLSDNGVHRMIYLVAAESEEKAKLQVPQDEKVISVKKLDGEGGDDR